MGAEGVNIMLLVAAAAVSIQMVFTLDISAVEDALFVDLGATAGYAGRYFLSNPLLNHKDSEFACTKLSPAGSLVHLDTPGELNFVLKQIVSQTYITERVHISGDGTSAPGQPQKCNAAIKQFRNLAGVTTLDCLKIRARFICEIQDVEPQKGSSGSSGSPIQPGRAAGFDFGSGASGDSSGLGQFGETGGNLVPPQVFLGLGATGPDEAADTENSFQPQSFSGLPASSDDNADNEKLDYDTYNYGNTVGDNDDDEFQGDTYYDYEYNP